MGGQVRHLDQVEVLAGVVPAAQGHRVGRARASCEATGLLVAQRAALPGEAGPGPGRQNRRVGGSTAQR